MAEASDGLLNYVDDYANLFAAYGSHRHLENNVTAAIGKTLMYGSRSLRASFVRELFPEIPVKCLPRDFVIRLQTLGDLDPSAAQSRFSVRLAPTSPLDAGDSGDEPAADTDDPRPDLWIIDRGGMLALLVETKLRPGQGVGQQKRQARKFRAERLASPRTFDAVYDWTFRAPARSPLDRLLLQSLAAFLDDQGLVGRFSGFHERDFAVSEGGSFEHHSLLYRKLRVLFAQVTEDPSCGTHPPVNARWGDGHSVTYFEFVPLSQDAGGYAAFGVHALDREYAVAQGTAGRVGVWCSAFLSGARSNMPINFTGRAGCDRFLAALHAARAAGRKPGFQKVIETLPVDSEVRLKLQRFQVTKAIDLGALAVFVKRGDGNFDQQGKRRPRTAAEVVDTVTSLIERHHGKRGRRYCVPVITRDVLDLPMLLKPKAALASLLRRELQRLALVVTRSIR